MSAAATIGFLYCLVFNYSVIDFFLCQQKETEWKKMLSVAGYRFAEAIILLINPTRDINLICRIIYIATSVVHF